MDVYVGFGLLSAALVVLVFVIFDSWLKSRSNNMAEMHGLNDKSMEDPEFVLSTESNELADLEMQENSNSHTTSVRDYYNPETLTDVQYDSSELEDLYDLEEANHEVDHVVEPSQATPNAEKASSPENLLVISVMAKSNNRFVSYDLLQAIATVGMQFGDMNIFHHYQQTMTGKISLFSLASANKPGDFDLNNIGNISCSGLVLFMDMSQVPDPQTVFRLMLDTAERLAEDLDGELHADPHTPWNEKLVWQYQQKIMQYKSMAKYDNKG